MLKKSVSTNPSCRDDKSDKSVQENNFIDVLIKELRFFTFSGTTGRFAFFALCYLWGIFFAIVFDFYLSPFVHLLALLACISIVFGTQRRCRDFHHRGTFFILTISLLEMVLIWSQYITALQVSPSFLWNIPVCYWITLVGSCSYLFLIFFPGKKDKTFTSTSPLLKHPYIYFGVWFILYLCGFYFFFTKLLLID